MTTPTTPATPAAAGAGEPVTILYTNWRGETAVRRIVPGSEHPGLGALWFGETEWHPGFQWLLAARDADKGVHRVFAFSGIKAWGQKAVDAALAAHATPSAAPAGWALVPKEMTPEMFFAVTGQMPDTDGSNLLKYSALRDYAMALAAAPPAPAPSGGDGEQPFYQYREIGEGEDWQICSHAVYEHMQSDPTMDTREVSAAALAPSPDTRGGAEAAGDLAGLSARATPGPWRHIVGDDYYIESASYPPKATHNPSVVDSGWWLAVGNRPDDFGEANSKFIVALVNAYRSGRLIEAPAAPRSAVGRETVDLDAAYEHMEAVSSLVQQGWDADECVYDEVRLRWLEEQARKSQTGISFDYIPSVDGEPSGFRFMRRFFVGAQCKTLRSAIDRAMKEDPQHKSDRATTLERPVTPAARDVLAERRRQIEAEGYTIAHDDEHRSGEIARAAACYAKIASNWDNYAFPEGCPADWPWSAVHWKWSNPRRDLVKAGALILAEIERLDRQNPPVEAPAAPRSVEREELKLALQLWHQSASYPTASHGERELGADQILALFAAPRGDGDGTRAFAIGARVQKTRGSSWQGRVCGYYSTALTPDGICVESEREPGSVQIYPAKALALSPPAQSGQGGV